MADLGAQVVGKPTAVRGPASTELPGALALGVVENYSSAPTTDSASGASSLGIAESYATSGVPTSHGAAEYLDIIAGYGASFRLATSLASEAECGAGHGSGIPPTVSNLVPAPGTPLLPSDAIQFDVTDTSDKFDRILLAFEYPNLGMVELCHDGDAFAPYFRTPTSSVTRISGGYRFIAARVGGWPDKAVTIHLWPINKLGTETGGRALLHGTD